MRITFRAGSSRRRPRQESTLTKPSTTWSAKSGGTTRRHPAVLHLRPCHLPTDQVAVDSTRTIRTARVGAAADASSSKWRRRGTTSIDGDMNRNDWYRGCRKAQVRTKQKKLILDPHQFGIIGRKGQTFVGIIIHRHSTFRFSFATQFFVFSFYFFFDTERLSFWGTALRIYHLNGLFLR